MHTECPTFQGYLINFVQYCIVGKLGGELNLAVWQSIFVTAKLKSTNISYLHIYVWQSLTEPPDLNLPIFCNCDMRPNYQI